MTRQIGLLSVGFVVSICTLAKADTLLFEDFEDAAVTYTTSVPEFTDGFGDYFTRTDGSDVSGTYTGFNGSFFFAAQDLDGEVASDTQYLNFNGINISGYSNLNFSGLFGEDTASDNAEDWDADDGVRIRYQIDGGGFQNLLAFEGEGNVTNAAAVQDTDFDGEGDGAELLEQLASFTAAIGGTGSALDLQIEISFDAGDEDIGFDDITITGDAVSAVVPEPAGFAIWLIIGTACAVGAVCLRKHQP